MENRSSAHPFELLAGGALGGLALIGGWAWTTAKVAGAVFGDRAPELALAAAVRAVPELPHHVGDPRMAFDEPARSALPGAVGWWLSAAVVTVGYALAVGLVVRVFMGTRRSRAAAS